MKSFIFIFKVEPFPMRVKSNNRLFTLQRGLQFTWMCNSFFLHLQFLLFIFLKYHRSTFIFFIFIRIDLYERYRKTCSNKSFVQAHGLTIWGERSGKVTIYSVVIKPNEKKRKTKKFYSTKEKKTHNRRLHRKSIEFWI